MLAYIPPIVDGLSVSTVGTLGEPDEIILAKLPEVVEFEVLTAAVVELVATFEIVLAMDNELVTGEPEGIPISVERFAGNCEEVAAIVDDVDDELEPNVAGDAFVVKATVALKEGTQSDERLTDVSLGSVCKNVKFADI